MKKDLVTMTKEEHLVILMLNNAPNNLLNDQFLNALEKQLILSKKNGARAILITTKLKHFSAGADPKFLLNRKENTDPMRLINIIEKQIFH